MKIDPYKHIGHSSTWGKFGEGEHDHHADAERRALADHFVRRLRKAAKQGRDPTVDILSGCMVSFAGLFVAAAGGPEGLDEDAFEKWLGVATFAFHQAVACFDGGSVQ